MYALYVCLICMPSMCALYTDVLWDALYDCLICMPYMYIGGGEYGRQEARSAEGVLCAFNVCLICMPDMYALYVCLICMPYMYALYVHRRWRVRGRQTRSRQCRRGSWVVKMPGSCTRMKTGLMVLLNRCPLLSPMSFFFHVFFFLMVLYVFFSLWSYMFFFSYGLICGLICGLDCGRATQKHI